MSANPIPGYAMGVLAASESAFGTPPNPAAAQIMEVIELQTGPSELGVTRGLKDRMPGRGMQNQFISGKVNPIDWTLNTSMKTRTANTTDPQESEIYAAAGLTKATGGSNVVYSMTANPLASVYSSLALYRCFGLAANGDALEAEQLRGGVVRSLSWRGGDAELMLTAQGSAIGKYHLGAIDSVTLSDDSGTSLSITAEESYRLGIGWYQIESEIIKITAITPGATSCTIARAALSSSAAAHSAKAMYPYFPTWTPSGWAPITEATTTATIGGVATRCTHFQVDLTTGLEHLAPETGSAYVQGIKVMRYDIKGKASLIMKGDDVRLIGRAEARTNTALQFVQGSAAGGIVTFDLPYCEIDPITVPAPANDVIALDVSFRVRDNSTGNNAMTITLT